MLSNELSDLVGRAQAIEQDLRATAEQRDAAVAEATMLTVQRDSLLVDLEQAKARIAELEAGQPPPPPPPPPLPQPAVPLLFRDRFTSFPSDSVYALSGQVPQPRDSYLFPVSGGLKVRIRSDQPYDASGHRRRCELRRGKDGTNIFLIDPPNVVRWYALTIDLGGFAGMFDKDFKAVKMVMNQLHQASASSVINGYGPPYTLHNRGDLVELIHCRAPNGVFLRRELMEWPLSFWTAQPRRIAAKVHWRNDSSGRFQYWVDGQLVVDDIGPQGYGVGVYWTCAGLYAVAWEDTLNPAPGQVRQATFWDARVGDERHTLADLM